MFACMHACMDACLHTSTHAHVNIPACMHACACIHASIHVCTPAFMHSCIHAFTLAHMFACVHAFMHACLTLTRGDTPCRCSVVLYSPPRICGRKTNLLGSCKYEMYVKYSARQVSVQDGRTAKQICCKPCCSAMTKMLIASLAAGEGTMFGCLTRQFRSIEHWLQMNVASMTIANTGEGKAMQNTRR